MLDLWSFVNNYSALSELINFYIIKGVAENSEANSHTNTLRVWRQHCTPLLIAAPLCFSLSSSKMYVMWSWSYCIGTGGLQAITLTPSFPISQSVVYIVRISPDLFEKMVPMVVQQSMSIYSQRKAETVNRLVGTMREATNLCNGYALPCLCGHMLTCECTSGTMQGKLSSCGHECMGLHAWL